MPISESLQLSYEAELPENEVEKHLNTRKSTLDAAHVFYDEYRRETQTNVFMDASNPL